MAQSSPQSPLLLFLKLAAAAAAGGAALLSFVRQRRRHRLCSLRFDLLSSLLVLGPSSPDGAARPPAVLITGFRSHGRSALVNTICRVLAGERGPLVMRAETAPTGPAVAAAAARRVIRADVAGVGEGDGEEEEEEGSAEVVLVDGAGLTEAAARADMEAEIAADVAVDCVVVVVRCGAPAKERRAAVRRLADVARVIRERGLHLVVVLTQKKALKSAKQAEELRREVVYKARTECVYFIENYTAGNTLNVRHPIAIKNDFDTHLTVLAIVRQCIEFARLYRSHTSQKTNDDSQTALLENQSLLMTHFEHMQLKMDSFASTQSEILNILKAHF